MRRYNPEFPRGMDAATRAKVKAQEAATERQRRNREMTENRPLPLPNVPEVILCPECYGRGCWKCGNHGVIPKEDR